MAKVKTITVDSIESKKTKSDKTFYIVKDDEGNEYSCWDYKFIKTLSEGEEAEVRVVVNGEYTNIEDPKSPEREPKSNGGSAPTNGGGKVFNDDLVAREVAVKSACELFQGTGQVGDAKEAARVFYAWMVGKELPKKTEKVTEKEEEEAEEVVRDIPF